MASSLVQVTATCVFKTLLERIDEIMFHHETNGFPFKYVTMEPYEIHVYRSSVPRRPTICYRLQKFILYEPSYNEATRNALLQQLSSINNNVFILHTRKHILIQITPTSRQYQNTTAYNTPKRPAIAIKMD